MQFDTFVIALKKDLKKISQKLGTVLILLGVIVGFLALTTSEPLWQEQVQRDQKEQGGKQADEPSESKEVLKAFEAINSTAQISLHHEYLLLETLPSFSEEEDEETSPDNQTSTAGSKVLRILFRRIISPNAP